MKRQLLYTATLVALTGGLVFATSNFDRTILAIDQHADETKDLIKFAITVFDSALSEYQIVAPGKATLNPIQQVTDPFNLMDSMQRISIFCFF